MTRTLIQQFDVTIPAGTQKTAPLVTSTAFEPNVVDHITWRFPGGCNGVVGIQIGSRAIPLIPFNTGQFLVTSGDSAGYDLEGMHTTGDWSVIGYNTGSFPHTIRVTFRVHRIERPEPMPGYLIADSVATMRGGG